MPKQTAKSGLAAKLGDKGRKAFDAHKADEVKFSGGGDLPAGVTGVAKIVKCGFGQYKEGKHKGEYFYMASAVVVEPKEYKGMRTSIGPEPMCETPERTGKTARKSVEDHMAFVINEFKKLGIETDDLSYEDFEPTAATIQDAGIHTRFRTYAYSKQEIVKTAKGYEIGGKVFKTEALAKAAFPYAGQEPRVMTDWTGVAEDYAVEESDDGVEDETAEETEVEEEAEVAEEESEEVEAEEEVAEESDDSESEEESESDGLSELAAKADKGDKKAKKELTTKAVEAGATEEDVENADNWEAVAEMIRNAGDSDEGEAEAEEEAEAEVEEEEEVAEEWKPEKGSVYKRLQPSAKDPKKKVKVEIEVLTVSEKNQTVTAKSLDSGKPIIGKDKKPLPIKWADLIHDE